MAIYKHYKILPEHAPFCSYPAFFPSPTEFAEGFLHTSKSLVDGGPPVSVELEGSFWRRVADRLARPTPLSDPALSCSDSRYHPATS